MRSILTMASFSETFAAISQIALKDWLMIIGLIFGGCCSNVFTLEKIVNENPGSGNVITFFQFLFIALEGYINFFDRRRPPFYLKQNKVPMKKWSLTIVMFFLLSLANNVAFRFNISMPIHIIFRSSGTAIVMIIGYIFAKKSYNWLQVLSSVLLSIGAIITTLYKDKEFYEFVKRQAEEAATEFVEASTEATGFLDTLSSDILYLIGIGVLIFAAILMAVMGLYNEHIYATYGKHWQENVFYSHLMGLPIFVIFLSPKIISEFTTLWQDAESFNLIIFHIPKQVGYLALNVITQFFCIRGANMLAGNATALTLSVVLLLRKFVSLLLSLWLFNNSLSYTGSFGATLVFGGAFLYSYGSTRKSKTMYKEIQQDEETPSRSPSLIEIKLEDRKLN